uniref:Cytochrome c oxidase subunit 3 n=1 Tax=Robertsicus elaphensis TaxID=2599317 RepID=H9M752_9ACAR|nr:cytochrome c oxidase subunit III [Robertsicus elaphensis]AET63069.1 cytochrome c oxidase subunit 3 [Robertsicus elaphensis]
MMYHPFHMVEKSPWPLTSSMSAFCMIMGILSYLNNKGNNLLMMSVICLIMSAYQWWRDISREASFQGYHTKLVLIGLKIGMLLFILSEIFFFLFFELFFHMSLSPSIEIGSIWPPKNIMPFNPFEIPLFNSMILISSGISVTWSHYSIMNKNYYMVLFSLKITIFLGLMFTIFQLWEYFQALFSISDSIFGSTFFLTTGFHGIHVIIGTMFLFISDFRINNNLISSEHFFGFEASIWYWHFVDVIWLFLFTFMYWWIY